MVCFLLRIFIYIIFLCDRDSKSVRAKWEKLKQQAVNNRQLNFEGTVWIHCRCHALRLFVIHVLVFFLSFCFFPFFAWIWRVPFCGYIDTLQQVMQHVEGLSGHSTNRIVSAATVDSSDDLSGPEDNAITEN